MYYPFSKNDDVNQRNMNRLMRENIAAHSKSLPGRRRPDPPRNLTGARSPSEPEHVLLGWTGPQDMSGILGYNVYLNNENNRLMTVTDPTTLQAVVTLPVVALPIAFYVSCFTDLLESIKVLILVTS